MTAEEIERDRKEAERCKFQSGTQGRWARKWLALYEEFTREPEAPSCQNCGQLLSARACGPTHALLARAAGVD